MHKWGPRGGEVFLKEVNGVLAKLRADLETASHAAGSSEAEQSTAFLDLYKKMEKCVQKLAVHALL